MTRFTDGYFDRMGLAESYSEITQEYMPQRGHLPKDADGNFRDDDKQEQYESALAALHNHKFEEFFDIMDMDKDAQDDFWDDWRDAYAAA